MIPLDEYLKKVNWNEVKGRKDTREPIKEGEEYINREGVVYVYQSGKWVVKEQCN